MIERPPYDENGGRWAKCTDCGMGWIEHREARELLPGSVTIAGERDHTCPPPMEYYMARAMAHSGAIVSQRVRASVKLGLKRGPQR